MQRNPYKAKDFHTQATSSLQVAVDMALTGLDEEPWNEGFYWVKSFRVGGKIAADLLFPSGQQLVEVKGDLSKLEPTLIPDGGVVCPAGTFILGGYTKETRNSSGLFPQVTFTCDFAIGKYPVTQRLYQAVVGKNPSFFSAGEDAMARPVEQVDWFEAVQFCNALSKILGLDPTYKIKTGKTPIVFCDRKKTGFRLPTEAEWEYAAKSGGEKYDFVAASNPGSVSWYHANSEETTHPVGEKSPNAWGIYDMLGNVYEWCQDRFAPYPDGDSVDYVQEKAGTTRVVRGGCWGTDVRSANPSVRRHNDPSVRAEFTGFRICRTLR